VSIEKVPIWKPAAVGGILLEDQEAIHVHGCFDTTRRSFGTFSRKRAETAPLDDR